MLIPRAGLQVWVSTGDVDQRLLLKDVGEAALWDGPTRYLLKVIGGLTVPPCPCSLATDVPHCMTLTGDCGFAEQLGSCMRQHCTELAPSQQTSVAESCQLNTQRSTEQYQSHQSIGTGYVMVENKRKRPNLEDSLSMNQKSITVWVSVGIHGFWFVRVPRTPWNEPEALAHHENSIAWPTMEAGPPFRMENSINTKKTTV